MIRLTRIALDGDLKDRLERKTALLNQRKADSRSARRSWTGAALERGGIRQALSRIAVGVERCMYCGDSRGTDIDHFEPISFSPIRTFDWNNHLLACSGCNSNAKRDAYPCDDDGECLLIDPTNEEPADHLELVFSIGEYTATTRKGSITIQIFQLNRSDLKRGREMAFARCKSMLRDYLFLMRSGRTEDAEDTKLSLEEQPFADVLYHMNRVTNLPGAERVLGGPDVLDVLRKWQEDSTTDAESQIREATDANISAASLPPGRLTADHQPWPGVRPDEVSTNDVLYHSMTLITTKRVLHCGQARTRDEPATLASD